MRNLRDQVVVITGARTCSPRDARTISRRRRACAARRAATRSSSRPKSPTKSRYANIAERALSLTGRVDVWVNNAGVTAFGPLDEGPFDVHRRVIETNVFGAMYGARAVLPIFKRQRAGILINVSSVLGAVEQPFVPSYVVSKFAIRGLSETLRSALADAPDIHVCTLLPYAFDSAHFESGANRMGVGAHPMPPMQSPEKVATHGHRAARASLPGLLVWAAGHFAKQIVRPRPAPEAALEPHTT